MMHSGKKIYTQEEFSYETARAGDWVDETVIDDLVNCLPPACMMKGCMQMGEPYSHREDPDSHEWRATFHTFRHFNGHIWEYCGKCFHGENMERGKDLVYARPVILSSSKRRMETCKGF